MTHFGIICPPYTGHLNPQTALGRELRARGHRVTVLQIPDLELKVRSEGLDFYPIGETTYQPGTLEKTLLEIAQHDTYRALHASIDFCREMAEMICRDAPGAIAATGIEALLVDQLEPAGETVAEGLGLPFICVSCGQAIHRRPDIPPFFTPWNYNPAPWAQMRNKIAYHFLDKRCEPILQVINQYRQQWHLAPYCHMYRTNTRLAHISQQPDAFDLPCPALPDYFHYVGPLRNQSPKLASFPYERLTGQPLIYASLGSVQNTKYGLFHCIAAACAGLDVQLVIAHGGGMTSEMICNLPGTPLVVEYAPQTELLSRASLTITHGGLNTVLDSLTHGVPLVAIPITFEQPGTGARIRWTRVGEVLRLNRLTPYKLTTAILQVFSDPAYRKNAQRVQHAIQQLGGARQAANIIEQAIQVKRPEPLSAASE